MAKSGSDYVRLLSQRPRFKTKTSWMYSFINLMKTLWPQVQIRDMRPPHDERVISVNFTWLHRDSSLYCLNMMEKNVSQGRMKILWNTGSRQHGYITIFCKHYRIICCMLGGNCWGDYPLSAFNRSTSPLVQDDSIWISSSSMWARCMLKYNYCWTLECNYCCIGVSNKK